MAAEQCEAAGLVVAESAAGEERQRFNDVAALVYYLLKVVSWAVPGFDVDVCRGALLKAHVEMKDAPFVVRQRRFLLVASRPGLRSRPGPRTASRGRGPFRIQHGSSSQP